MAKKAGRGTTKNIFFKNQEMNFTVLRALMGVYDDGATIGECLRVVQNTKNGDIETFIKEWQFDWQFKFGTSNYCKGQRRFDKSKRKLFSILKLF